MRQTNRRIAAILDQIKMEPLMSDAAAGAANLRRITERTEASLDRVLGDSAEAAERINRLTRELERSGDIPATTGRLSRTARRLDSLVADQRPEIERIIENLRIFSEDLREISERGTEYPAHLFFGAPPPPPEGVRR
jgi:ABC-type transporter Mla subunit MlaD